MRGPDPATGRPAIVVRWHVNAYPFYTCLDFGEEQWIPRYMFINRGEVEGDEVRWALFGDVEAVEGHRWGKFVRHFVCQGAAMEKPIILISSILSDDLEEKLEEFGMLQERTPEAHEVAFIPYEDTEVYHFSDATVLTDYVVVPIAFFLRGRKYALLVEVQIEDPEEGPVAVEYELLN